MFRFALTGLLLIASFTSCASTETYDVPTSPEMIALEQLVGHWRGTAEFLVVPESMAEMIKPDANGDYPKMGGRNSTRYGLSGTVLIQEGWHEMGEGLENHYIEVTRWDAEAGNYHSWYFSNMGEVGEGIMTFDPATKMFTVNSEGTRPDGTEFSGSGTMTFVDRDHIEWTWTEDSGLEMAGSNTRS